jgi:inorganic pyrophosphatase
MDVRRRLGYSDSTEIQAQMNPWHDIHPDRITPERFMAVIEIPKGSKKKYELDKETGLLRLDRILFTSTHYPMNYGFVPLTLADDGDPLDVLVLCSEVLDPLVEVDCYPIGVVRMIDNAQIDEKIICIPLMDPTYNGYRDISVLPRHVVQEVSHFFDVYKALEHSSTSVKETGSREDAARVVSESILHYRSVYPGRFENKVGQSGDGAPPIPRAP